MFALLFIIKPVHTTELWLGMQTVVAKHSNSILLSNQLYTILLQVRQCRRLNPATHPALPDILIIKTMAYDL